MLDARAEDERCRAEDARDQLREVNFGPMLGLMPHDEAAELMRSLHDAGQPTVDLGAKGEDVELCVEVPRLADLLGEHGLK